MTQERSESLIITNREHLRCGEIPSIAIYGRTLPEVWEDSVVATYEYGTKVPTQYDQPEDPESRDASVMMTISDPLAEPRIHKAGLPTGYDELYVYTQEVVKGVHDWRVQPEGWSYSYHDRIVNWPGSDGWEKVKESMWHPGELPHVDQLETLVQTLVAAPHSRRAQAITWNPLADALHHEPPCLQRLWCRVVRSGNDYLLEMNTHWRSRDALKAAFMNMFALTELQRALAERLTQETGREIKPGRYVDVVDSYHLYGSYMARGEIAAFLTSLEKRSFEQRTIRSDHAHVLFGFEDGRERLEKEEAERSA